MRKGLLFTVLGLSVLWFLLATASIPDWPRDETAVYYVVRVIAGQGMGLAGIGATLALLIGDKRRADGTATERPPRPGAGWQRPPHDVD